MNFPDFKQNSKFPWLILKFPDFSLTLNFPDFSLTSGNPISYFTFLYRGQEKIIFRKNCFTLIYSKSLEFNSKFSIIFTLNIKI